MFEIKVKKLASLLEQVSKLKVNGCDPITVCTRIVSHSGRFCKEEIFHMVLQKGNEINN